jgi:hypothetical protein
MEKQRIEINYSGSGVKSLRGFGTFFLIIAFIATIVTVIGFIIFLSNLGSYRGEENALIGISLAASFFLFAIGSFACGAICRGLATIAEEALFKKTVIDEQYDLVEVGDAGNLWQKLLS